MGSGVCVGDLIDGLWRVRRNICGDACSFYGAGTWGGLAQHQAKNIMQLCRTHTHTHTRTHTHTHTRTHHTPQPFLAQALTSYLVHEARARTSYTRRELVRGARVFCADVRPWKCESARLCHVSPQAEHDSATVMFAPQVNMDGQGTRREAPMTLSLFPSGGVHAPGSASSCLA